MFRSMLVPLDGSEFAEEALRVAEAWAEPRTTLHLVTVHRPVQAITMADDLGVVSAADREVRAREVRYLDEVARAAAARRSAAVVHRVVDGGVAEALAGYAERHDVELVVMSTHGRGGVSRFWLGSVADRMVRLAPAPVLVVRGAVAANHALGRIVVPMDGTPVGEAVLDDAVAFAQRRGYGISLVQVVPLHPAPLVPPTPAGFPDDDLTPTVRLAALRRLHELAVRLRALRIDVRVDVVEGDDPARAILEYAERERAGLLVVGTRARRGLERLVLGSVADKLLRAAEIPVFLRHVTLPTPEAHAVPVREGGLMPQFAPAPA